MVFRFFFLLLSSSGCMLFTDSASLDKNKINGISYAAANELLTDKDINSIKNIEANWVALIPYAFIQQGESKLVYNSDRQWIAETTEGIVKEILKAKQGGLKIMLKPHVWISHGAYTGNFELENEDEWEELEDTYYKYIMEFAQIAEKQQVELFCIGTEWRKFIQQRPVFWSKLIRDVRSVYLGKITYASNWDEYMETPFWSELDYIGVNAYFPLSESKEPTVEQLDLAWQPILNLLGNLSKDVKKPILFTEYGYRSIIGTTIRPWESYTNAKISMKEQEIALEALFINSWSKPWFAGGFLWKWFNKNQIRGGLENDDYTIQNKPAQEFVKIQYGQNK